MALPRVDGQAWIRRFHPARAGGVQLVCLPHAGGSASFYFPLSKALSPAVEVLAVQYPGRQDRLGDPLLDTVGDLADHVAAAVLPLTGRPFALFGHSMGAVLAYEMTARLVRLGATPSRLFVSGRRAPAIERDERVHLRDDDGLVEELGGLDGTDTSVFADPEVRAMILPAVRSDYRAIETYRYTPRPPVPCPLTVLVGDADPKVPVEDARAWTDHAAGPHEVHVLPGGHFYLADHVERVASLVSARLLDLPRGAR